MSTPVSASTYNWRGYAYVSATTDIPVSATPVDYFTSGAVSGNSTDQQFVAFLNGSNPQESIYQPPVFAAFTYAISNYRTVNFTDTSTGIEYYRLWDFGDGYTSTDKNPSHTYADFSATYTVTLGVSGASNTSTVSHDVTTDAAPNVSASFTYVISNQKTVQFTDTTSAVPDTWLWNFGDGTSATTQNPSHTYADYSTPYTVVLTVSGYNQQTSATNIITTEAIPASADFSYSLSADNLTFGFTDTSTGTVLSWAWDFGDGTSATTQNPSHTYANYSTPYTVTLTLNGNAIFYKTKIVTTSTPIPSFTWVNTIGKRIAFTDTSQGATSWSWDFGDLSSSAVQNPTHVYADYNASYNVTLTINGAYSTSATIITGSQVANFTWFDVNRNITFTDTSTSATSWLWDFDDGSYSTSQNPTHAYSNNFQDYNVTLTINGGLDSKTIVVSPIYSNFSWSPSGTNVTFYADETHGDLTYWSWNFGDGTSGTGYEVSHNYANYDTEYPLTLFVSGANGYDSQTFPIATQTQDVFANFNWRLPVLQLVIDKDKVMGNITDFTCVFTEENFSDDFLILSGGLTPNVSGGDIRFYGDRALTQELPIDIVFFSLTDDRNTCEVEINVKIPALTTSADTSVYVTWGNPLLNKRDPTDTYGAYNAYKAGFKLWSPMVDVTPMTVGDRTSNQYVGRKSWANHPSSEHPINPYIHEGQFFNAENEVYTDPYAVSGFTCDNTAHTIFRTVSGSFIDEGFVSGMRINISAKLSGSTTLDDINPINGLRTIETVTADTITVLSSDILPDGVQDIWIAACDHITFPSFPTGEVFTVFCPFNATISAQSWNGLVYNKYWWATAHGFEFNLVPNYPQRLQIVGSNSNNQSKDIFNNVLLDGWESLAVRVSGTSALTFVNGVTQDYFNLYSPTSASPYPYFMLGTTPNHVALFSGWIDQFIIYVGLLTSAEIRTMQNNQRDRASFASYVELDREVSFRDLTTTTFAPISTWRWDFGDGTSGTTQHPIHNYEHYNTAYTVRLFINEGTGIADSITQTVTTGPIPCTANFSTTQIDGYATYGVTDTSTGYVASWLWNWGDGVSASGQSPANHVYPEYDQTYVIGLTLNGDSNIYKSQTVFTYAPPSGSSLSADFTVDGYSAPVDIVYWGNSMTVANTTSGSYTSAQWVFAQALTSTYYFRSEGSNLGTWTGGSISMTVLGVTKTQSFDSTINNSIALLIAQVSGISGVTNCNASFGNFSFQLPKSTAFPYIDINYDNIIGTYRIAFPYSYINNNASHSNTIYSPGTYDVFLRVSDALSNTGTKKVAGLVILQYPPE